MLSIITIRKTAAITKTK
jgi:hypothetical protein